ncbi:MAG: YdcF family protein [Verrucomicrobiales bacterium]|nr:YdcF family protein [Verrucomicrobiales bacterium]
MWKKFRRALKWILVLTLAATAWCGYVAWDIVSFGGRDEARPSDVAIVLGAAAYDRQPSPVLEERVNHALELYRKHLVRKLLFTGGFGDGAPMAESQVARSYAMRQGIPEGDILIETTSRSTVENLIESRRLMQAHGLASAIVVSDPLQMRRAMKILRDLNVPACSSPTPTSRFRSTDKKLDFLLSEVYKYHVYLLAGK